MTRCRIARALLSLRELRPSSFATTATQASSFRDRRLHLDGCAPHVRSQFITPTAMAIQLRLLGTVTDAVRRLTFTPSGKPRFTFGVRVGTIRTRHYLVTAYGTTAKFADLFLRTGQRIRIEGAFLRRVPTFEGAVRGDTIRHVGGAMPPMNGTLVRLRFPQPPASSPPTPRPIPHAHAEHREAASEARVDAAITAAVN